jgi:LytS/YehU family sensor histidine kinase
MGLWLTIVIILLILLGICLVLLYRLYTRSPKEEQSKAELKQKLAEMEMKALRAQMSPHFIFNSLNSINRYIVKSDPETASAYLTKFAKLMRLILENSNHKLISLDQELNALRLYIELEALRFNNKFSYIFSVDADVDTMTFGLPPMIIQPYIENAIWHGLLQKESPGMLQVIIKRSPTGIQCIILDDGIGRMKAAELKSKSINSEKSYGMKITADRMNIISKNKKISSVEITDLADEFGNAQGTKVILEVARGKIEEF